MAYRKKSRDHRRRGPKLKQNPRWKANQDQSEDTSCVESDDNSSDEERDECVVCKGVGNQQNGEIIRPCGCIALDLGYHFECLVRWMRIRGDIPCIFCGQPFIHPRIARTRMGFWRRVFNSIDIVMIIKLIALLAFVVFVSQFIYGLSGKRLSSSFVLGIEVILCIYAILDFVIRWRFYGKITFIVFTHLRQDGSTYEELLWTQNRDEDVVVEEVDE